MNDLGLAPFVRRVPNAATSAGAAVDVLEINTFGGRVDAAVQNPRRAAEQPRADGCLR
jgi:hypothetical protein